MILSLLLCWGEQALAKGFAVQPLYLEFKPRGKVKKERFEIKITTESAIKLKLGLFKAEQDLTGKLSFKELPPVDKNSNIITLDKKKYQINRAGLVKVRGSVTYPRKQNKTAIYAIMIEEDRSKSETGISINVRYAVVLKVQTSKRKTMIRITLDSIKIEPMGGNLVLSSVITNKSVKDFDIEAIAKIRRPDNSVVETVDIRSGSAWQRNDRNSIIFPSSRVSLFGKITKSLSPGTYKVTINGKIDKKRPVSARGSVKISQSQLKAQDKSALTKGDVGFTPLPMNIIYKEKGASYYRFQVSNPTGEKLTVDLPQMGKEATEKYEYSFVPSKVSLRPNSKKNIMFKIMNKVGPNLTLKHLKALVTNKAGKIIRSVDLPVSFVEK